MSPAESRTELLEMQGWARRFIANEPRLTEAVEMYKESGFEVHLEPLPNEAECESCTGKENANRGECCICFEGVVEQYRIIFTRPRKNQGRGDRDNRDLSG